MRMRLKPASEAEGRRFNSCRARQNLCEKGPARNRRPLFCGAPGMARSALTGAIPEGGASG